MKAAIEGQERLDRMRSNMLRFQGPRLRPRRISICGYGPSLSETWKEITGDVMTVSGAHDFLISRGIVPDYHVECDPRPHKTEFLRKPHPGVTYLINSICHPSMFEALEGYQVVMWHGVTDDDAKNQIDLAESIEPGSRLLNGGTTAGVRSMPVARERGYTDFDLHGMDCSYHGEKQWAGPHFGKRHKSILVQVGQRIFETSDLMLQACDDFFEALKMLSGCRFAVHGGGLLEARLRLFNANPEFALSGDWYKFIGVPFQLSWKAA